MHCKWGGVNLHLSSAPEHIGYSDACGIGAGGVWTSGTKGLNPVVWQVEWIAEVKDAFAKGILTINDLELAGLVLEWMALECLLPSLVRGQHFRSNPNPNPHFPLPSQKDSWIELKIPSKWQQRVMSCLLGELSMQALLQPLPRIVRNIGQHGADTVPNGSRTHKHRAAGMVCP